MTAEIRMLRRAARRRAPWIAIALAAALGCTPRAWAVERALDKQVDVVASVDKVWQAWTTREGVISFFAPDAQVEARVGGAFQIYFDPGAPPGTKGADDMRYLALQPKKMLSFDWNAPPSLPEARQQRTFVVVRIMPIDDKTTRVTLHHTGWGEGGEWDKAYAYFDRAWGFVLGNLKNRFEQGPIDWQPWLAQLERSRSAASAGGAPAASAAAARVPAAASR
jgi:uncharacterized protein YndB with AHSA1/START domain